MLLFGLRRTMGVMLGLALVFGAVSAWAQTGGLTGKAVGENGEPLVGHPIVIERQDVKGVYRTKTNKKGEYIYIGLPIGNYKITLQNPSGTPLFFLQTRVSMGDPTQVDFDLGKEKVRVAEERQKQLEANPELKRKVEEQEKEQKQLTSLKQIFDEGQALVAQQRYPEAVQMFEQALPMAKGNNIAVVLSALAQAYARARMNDKAVETYLKAMQANPNEAGLHDGLGNVYAAMGKTQEAAAEFQKAAEMNPAQASRYHYNYGVIMYNQGKMDEAAAAFQKAIEANASYADAYFMRGRALMAKLDLDPATGKVIAAPGTVEALEGYLKLEPEGKYAAEAQSMLQTVTGTVQTEYKKPKKPKS